MGSPSMETSPTITVTIGDHHRHDRAVDEELDIRATFRRGGPRGRYFAASPGRRPVFERPRVHRGASRAFCRPSDDHPIAGLEPARDDPGRPAAIPDGDGC